jgi:hypothetical protein
MMISNSSSAEVSGSFAHPEIVEDEQGYGHEELHALFTRAVQSGFGQLIEQGVA